MNVNSKGERNENITLETKTEQMDTDDKKHVVTKTHIVNLQLQENDKPKAYAEEKNCTLGTNEMERIIDEINVEQIENSADLCHIDQNEKNSEYVENPTAGIVEKPPVEILSNKILITEPIVNNSNSIDLEQNEDVQELDDDNDIKSTHEKPKVQEILELSGISESLEYQPMSSAHSNALGLLAQYDSDITITDSEGDSDDVMEVPVNSNANIYRNKVVEVTSGSSSDSSDDSSDESDIDSLSVVRKEIEGRLEDNDESDDSDEENDEHKNRKGKAEKTKRKNQPPKVKGEKTLDDLPPIQDLHITVPEEECIHLGQIQSIVEQLVLVSALPRSALLDLDTVLFLDKGKRVLGEIFDVLGQVADPLYCIRFNSNEQIQEKGIHVGELVYVAPKTKYTQFVILSNIMSNRGSDASWENDIEPPPHCVDYSDDEEERAARSRLRNKNRATDHNDQLKRQRNNSENSELEEERQPTNQQSRPSNRQRQFNNVYRGFNPRRGSWHSNYYSHNQKMNNPNNPMSNFPMPQQSYGMPMYPPQSQYYNPYLMPSQPMTQWLPNPYAIRPPVIPSTWTNHSPSQMFHSQTDGPSSSNLQMKSDK